jgi:CCR4-NOT transcription complex subunit 1
MSVPCLVNVFPITKIPSQSWSSFHKHLLSFFKFMSPFLKNADLPPAVQDLFRGALRMLLVLIHDFPDFLSEYYFTLCDAIPPRCIQMRNLILCAFPPSINLPDPYLPGVTFDGIPEMGPIPPILSDFISILQAGDLKGGLEQFLLNRGGPSFLPSLKDRLRLTTPSPTTDETYNLSLMNSIVMYIGVSTVAQAKARNGSLFSPSDPGVVILQYLATNLDVEGTLESGSPEFAYTDIIIFRPAPPSQRGSSAPPLP